MPSEQESSAQETWVSRFPTIGDSYALVLSALFLLIFLAGVRALILRPGTSYAAPLPGLIVLPFCAYVLWNPARRVTKVKDGSITFSRGARHKGVTVKPGDIVSIQYYLIFSRYRNRLSPLIVTSRGSVFRFRPPAEGAEDLIRELRKSNPHAVVDDWLRT